MNEEKTSTNTSTQPPKEGYPVKAARRRKKSKSPKGTGPKTDTHGKRK